MPEIVITEKDLTTGYVEAQDFVVFVPGNVGKAKIKETDTQKEIEAKTKQWDYIGKTTLFNDLDEFLVAIGEDVTTYSDTGTPFTIGETTYDSGYLYAKFLLDKGFKVYYAVPKASTQTKGKTISTDVVDKTKYSVPTTVTKTEFETPQTVTTTIGKYDAYTNVTKSVTTNYNAGTATFVGTSASGTSTVTLKYPLSAQAGNEYATEQEVTSWFTSGTFTRTIDEVVYTFNQLITTLRVTTTLTGDTYKVQSYADMVIAVNDNTLYTDLDDKSLYQFRFLTTGGYVVSPKDEGVVIPTAITKLVDIANLRGDCVAVIDHAYNLTDAKDIIQSGTNAQSKRATMFSPWCKYDLINNDDGIQMPASMAYLEAFINGVRENPTWYAMAGRLRGNITGTPIRKYGENFANKLTNYNGDDTGVSVNPIAYTYPYGLLIWGNRTLNNNAGITASSLLNIRQLVIDIFKSLYINAKGYMFEQNTDRLWFNFKSNIETLLNEMQTGEGIDGYKIVKQVADRVTIKAKVIIVPIGAVEKFDLTVVLADTISVEMSE